MLESLEKVKNAKNDHDITFFGLSTCGWCRKTRNLLDDEEQSYKFVYVDLLEGEEQNEVIEEIKKHNPKLSFPTVIVDGEVIIGFKEDKYRELFS